MGRLLARSCLIAMVGAIACAPARSAPAVSLPDAVKVTARASGTFEVSLTPEAGAEHPGGISLGRMSMEKVFHGDIEGTSRGEMLTARTPVPSSAGYVAIERVSGTLHGRAGTFVLQHNGTMADGDQELIITVVPDSGTGELAGLTGRMTIAIQDGAHSYELEYGLPETDG